MGRHGHNGRAKASKAAPAASIGTASADRSASVTLPSASAFTFACVTGTNGKTTTASLIEAIVAASGAPSARITTIGAWVRGEQMGEGTTDAVFRRAIIEAERAKVKTVVVETTSYGLTKGFARDWPPTVAVFTNLSRDHLDYHGTPERYLAAKAQLFMNLLQGGVAVLNAMDPSSALLDEVTPAHAVRSAYAAGPVDAACAHLPLDLKADRVTVDRAGTHVDLAPSPFADALGGALRLALLGHHHAENALGAALAGRALGVEPLVIKRAIEGFSGVPGRFEAVRGERAGGPLIVVDYAHTPDALAGTLALARSLVEGDRGRVLCVFGCGGERDRGKRPEMGRTAAHLADIVLITSDNPRSEDPASIADQIIAGMEGRFESDRRILDRAGAINRAVELAGEHDIVVIAGKGHEKTQIFRDRVVPFDDVQVARSALVREKR